MWDSLLLVTHFMCCILLRSHCISGVRVTITHVQWIGLSVDEPVSQSGSTFVYIDKDTGILEKPKNWI